MAKFNKQDPDYILKVTNYSFANLDDDIATRQQLLRAISLNNKLALAVQIFNRSSIENALDSIIELFTQESFDKDIIDLSSLNNILIKLNCFMNDLSLDLVKKLQLAYFISLIIDKVHEEFYINQFKDILNNRLKKLINPKLATLEVYDYLYNLKTFIKEDIFYSIERTRFFHNGVKLTYLENTKLNDAYSDNILIDFFKTKYEYHLSNGTLTNQIIQNLFELFEKSNVLKNDSSACQFQKEIISVMKARANRIFK
jgi:hypothetical protein